MNLTRFSEFQPNHLNKYEKTKVSNSLPSIEIYCSRINEAKGFSGVWKIVKETVKLTLHQHRLGILLFLDDLPLHLGAYHMLGTNNIILNRSLLNIVKAITKSKKIVNAFIYSILIHEYLHSLGHISETEVRSLVYKISKKCFGENHIVTKLALKTPWSILQGISLKDPIINKNPMELIKNLEEPNQKYIV